MKYQLHQEVLHMGKPHKIIGKDGKNLIIYPKGSGEVNTAIVVPPHHVAPICNSKFEIGDPVESYNTFRGTVVGFEKETGRILCRSDKHDRRLDNERTRGGIYAYLPHEIKLREICPSFVVNGQYRISFDEEPCRKRHVRILKHPQLVGCFAVYDTSSGDYLMAVDARVSDDELFRYGITKHSRLC